VFFFLFRAKLSVSFTAGGPMVLNETYCARYGATVSTFSFNILNDSNCNFRANGPKSLMRAN